MFSLDVDEEIEGGTLTLNGKSEGLMRDAQLTQDTGFQVIRFTNDDVMRNIDGVLKALHIELESQSDRWNGKASHHPPAPSPEEEGE